ncbi:hypothetical protein Suden_1698 [Sulfurimonas denitrificans DSM 1251]|uniref:Integrase catalytic domain-containing protein n=1 Tax=Sulfurimonas denitrificans (strain ATCC 33889 / DSM 1251) TaxID=326298 RepID=Q30PV7_SULDN|nr:hypothetical protein Suden_1698 [Sulfurimonas denitrificans DSM 1251]
MHNFFKSLKKELVRKQIFLTREVAASKIFEYIEMFYNSKRRHSYLGHISPNEFENMSLLLSFGVRNLCLPLFFKK